MIVAFNKNPLRQGENTNIKDYSVDLENRIENEFDNVVRVALSGGAITDPLTFWKGLPNGTLKMAYAWTTTTSNNFPLNISARQIYLIARENQYYGMIIGIVDKRVFVAPVLDETTSISWIEIT